MGKHRIEEAVQIDDIWRSPVNELPQCTGRHLTGRDIKNMGPADLVPNPRLYARIGVAIPRIAIKRDDSELEFIPEPVHEIGNRANGPAGPEAG